MLCCIYTLIENLLTLYTLRDENIESGARFSAFVVDNFLISNNISLNIYLKK